MESTPGNSANRSPFRGSATTWVLSALAVVIVLVAGDQIRRAVQGPPPPTKEQMAEQGPVVSNAVKDFELPDMNGRARALSEFKGQEFVLAFFCGCDECHGFATELAKAYRQTKAPAPPTIVVMSSDFDPHAAPSFIRATHSDKFLYLFAETRPDFVELYHGHPCPKVFLVDKDFVFDYVSPTPTAGSYVMVLQTLARMLNLNWQPSAELLSKVKGPGGVGPGAVGAQPAGPNP